MDFIHAIEAFVPDTPEEAQSQRIVLDFIRRNPDNVLYRKNEIAHLTSSGFILNPEREKALLVYHNILDTWAWTGGHADGDTNFLQVALREAREETGVKHVQPLHEQMVSIDILPVNAHIKNGRYITAHLHLNVTYFLICPETDALTIKPDENSGVRWFRREEFTPELFNKQDLALYTRLFSKV